MSQEKFRSQLSSFADAAVFQGIPHLRLSPATHTLELYLPALTAGYQPEDPQWTVSAQLLDDSEDTRKFYYVEGEEPGLWISMPHPFSHLSVSFEEHTLEFAGVANGGLVLDSTIVRSIPPQRCLKAHIPASPLLARNSPRLRPAKLAHTAPGRVGPSSR